MAYTDKRIEEACMKRQFAIFVMTFLLIAVIAAFSLPRVLGDLVPATPNPEAVIVLQAADRDGCAASDLLLARHVIDQRLAYLEMGGDYEIVVREPDKALQLTLPAGEATPQLVNVVTQIGEVKFVDAGSRQPQPGHLDSVGDYQTIFSSGDISAVSVPEAGTGELFYQLTLQPEAAPKLDKFDTSTPGSFVCLAVDDVLASCSEMYHRNGNTLEILPSISGDITVDELALLLSSGPLPTRFEIIE
jgi:hypothetical protein